MKCVTVKLVLVVGTCIMYVYSREHLKERIMFALPFVSNPLQYF